MFSVRDAGAVTLEVTAIKAHDGVTTRTIVRARVMDSDGVTLRTVYTASGGGAMTVSCAPAFAYGAIDSTTPAPVTTNSVTATPTGGVGPFAYAWANIAGEPGAVALSATSATTAFYLAGVPAGSSESATFRVTVTDALGNTATADVVASFDNVNVS